MVEDPKEGNKTVARNIRQYLQIPTLKIHRRIQG